jgi:hypothetical protein
VRLCSALFSDGLDRSYNQAIYQASDMGIAINMLPGDAQDLSSSSVDVLSPFPLFSPTSLCKPDLILMFRLVSLHTSPFLQTPVGALSGGGGHRERETGEGRRSLDEGYENIQDDDEPSSLTRASQFIPSFDVLSCTGCFSRQHDKDANSDSHSSKSRSSLDLKGLLEAIRKGRVFLLNAFQVALPRTNLPPVISF